MRKLKHTRTTTYISNIFLTKIHLFKKGGSTLHTFMLYFIINILFAQSLRALRWAWIWARWHVAMFLCWEMFMFSVIDWMLLTVLFFVFPLVLSFLFLCSSFLPLPSFISLSFLFLMSKMFWFSMTLIIFIDVQFYRFPCAPFLYFPFFLFVFPLPSFIHKEKVKEMLSRT